MPNNKQNSAVRLSPLRSIVWVLAIVLLFLGVKEWMGKPSVPPPGPGNNGGVVNRAEQDSDVVPVTCGEVISADYKTTTKLKRAIVHIPAYCASGRVQAPKGTTGIITCSVEDDYTGLWYYPAHPHDGVLYEDKASHEKCGGKDPPVIAPGLLTLGMPEAFALRNPQGHKIEVIAYFQRNP